MRRTFQGIGVIGLSILLWWPEKDNIHESDETQPRSVTVNPQINEDYATWQVKDSTSSDEEAHVKEVANVASGEVGNTKSDISPLQSNEDKTSKVVTLNEGQQRSVFFASDKEFSKFKDYHHGFDGLTFPEMLSRRSKNQIETEFCVEGQYDGTVPDGSESRPLSLKLDICVGSPNNNESNGGSLTFGQRHTTFTRREGIPKGFWLVDHEKYQSFVVNSAKDLFEFFFFGNRSRIQGIWYQISHGDVYKQRAEFELSLLSRDD